MRKCVKEPVDQEEGSPDTRVIYIVYFAQSAAKTDTVYTTQKIDTQTKEKTYENIKTLGNMQNTYTH